MQPALPSPMPDASPAVFAVNDRKPHQGVAGKNPGLHQRFAACNSTTALGVSWGLSAGTVPGARVTYDYDAFGNQITHTGTMPNNYMYRGEAYDSDLGLYYLRARWMNPLTGRFLSRDPEDGIPTEPISLHKYVYADGDPVNASDPSGRAAVAEDVEVTIKIDIGALPAVAAAGCAVKLAYNVLALKVVNDFDITPTAKCGAKGKGRMRIQLQFGKAGQGTTASSRIEVNDDPPGVLLAQVGGDLASIWGEAQGGAIPSFPKSLNWDLKTALVDVSVCAKRIVAGGGVVGAERTVCQGLVGNSGWRVDLDQLNGWNLRQ